MKLLITSSPDFDDTALLIEKCDRLLSKTEHIEIVSTRQTTTDTRAEVYALCNDHPVTAFKTLAEAVEYSDAMIVFWDGLPGDTEDLIKLAQETDLKIRIVKY